MYSKLGSEDDKKGSYSYADFLFFGMCLGKLKKFKGTVVVP